MHARASQPDRGNFRARLHLAPRARSRSRTATELVQWVRIVDPAGLTGLTLMLSERPAAGAAEDWRYQTFWGNGAPFVVDTPADLRRQGVLPPAGAWTRLEASADVTWRVDGSVRLPLAGHGFSAVRFMQNGGMVEWGPLSKIDAAGNETLFVADDVPPGGALHQSGSASGWPWVAAGPSELPTEADFGTASPDGARRAAALDALRARWSQPFLADDFEEITETGVDGFAALIESKIRTTNDAIDLGFVRARADIYRVRQYMLGADTASRLVTSPSLADVAVREESARARSEKISGFRPGRASGHRRFPAAAQRQPTVAATNIRHRRSSVHADARQRVVYRRAADDRGAARCGRRSGAGNGHRASFPRRARGDAGRRRAVDDADLGPARRHACYTQPRLARPGRPLRPRRQRRRHTGAAGACRIRRTDRKRGRAAARAARAGSAPLRARRQACGARQPGQADPPGRRGEAAGDRARRPCGVRLYAACRRQRDGEGAQHAR